MADFKEAGRILARADVEGFDILNTSRERCQMIRIRETMDRWAGRSITNNEWQESVDGYNDVIPLNKPGGRCGTIGCNNTAMETTVSIGTAASVHVCEDCAKMLANTL